MTLGTTLVQPLPLHAFVDIHLCMQSYRSYILPQSNDPCFWPLHTSRPFLFPSRLRRTRSLVTASTTRDNIHRVIELLAYDVLPAGEIKALKNVDKLPLSTSKTIQELSYRISGVVLIRLILFPTLIRRQKSCS